MDVHFRGRPERASEWALMVFIRRVSNNAPCALWSFFLLFLGFWELFVRNRFGRGGIRSRMDITGAGCGWRETKCS